MPLFITLIKTSFITKKPFADQIRSEFSKDLAKSKYNIYCDVNKGRFC